jgi:hypothetical protein
VKRAIIWRHFYLVGVVQAFVFVGGGSVMAFFFKKALKQPAIATITITKVL